MIKRVNSLGRKRVPRDCVQIEVADGDPRTFSATIDFGDANWPHDASVVLEATCAGSSLVQRVPCGTIGALEPPNRIPLHDLHGQNVFFALKIIDTGQRIGRLLGLAENVRPTVTGQQTVRGRKGILPVEHATLGQQLWRLEFRDHDVFLLVNKDVPGLAEMIRSDPAIFPLIYPQIIRQVLARAIDEGADADDVEDDRWPALWVAFGRKLHPEHAEPPLPDEEEAVEEWIETVIDSFCQLHQLRGKFEGSAYLSGSGD